MTGAQELLHLRSELEGYINSVDLLEEENSLLLVENETIKLKLLEERAKVKETFLQAKASWRDQAIDYACKQKKRALEANTVVAADDDAAATAADDDDDVMSLRRAVREASHAHTMLNAVLAAREAPLLLDFDSKDGHVCIHNGSGVTQNLVGASIHFLTGIKLSYTFLEGCRLTPGDKASVWWGRANARRGFPDGNSYFWATCEDVDADAVAVLRGPMGEDWGAVRTNQAVSASASSSASASLQDDAAETVHSPATKKQKKSNRSDENSTCTNVLRPRLVGRQPGPLCVARVLYGAGESAILVRNYGDLVRHAKGWKLHLESASGTVAVLPLPSFEMPAAGAAAVVSSKKLADHNEELRGIALVSVPELMINSSLVTLALLDEHDLQVATFLGNGLEQVLQPPPEIEGCVVM